jgi:ATP-dependent protease ClpP protease subunit
MAYEILQSCTNRVMTSRSSLLTHEARLGGVEPPVTIAKLKAALEDLEVTSFQLAQIGSHRLKISFAEYTAKTRDHDYIMDYREAKRIGAVDLVVGGSALEYIALVRAGVPVGGM